METRRRALAATLLSVAVLLLASPVQAQTIYPPQGGSGAGGWEPYITDTSLSIPTSGTSIEVLRTFTLPANYFPTLYRGFRLVTVAVGAANTNNKTLAVRKTDVSGTVISSSLINASGAHTMITLECYPQSATTLMCFGSQGLHNTVGNVVNFQLTSLDFTADLAFVVCGTTATAAADMSLTMLQVQFFRP